MKAIDDLLAYRQKMEQQKRQQLDEYGNSYNSPQFSDDLLPKVINGSINTGFCEVEIPNTVVGLIIGKNASNVKAMKDRTRCDIRVQKDEDTPKDAKARKVALKGIILHI